MREILVWRLCLALLPVTTLAQSPAPALDGEELKSCVGSNMPARSYTGNIALQTTDAHEQKRQLQARFIGRRKNESLALNLRLTAPSDMAGTTLLIKEQKGEDSVHVYLPGLRRSRRVVGSMAEKEIWGTGLSYLDFKQLFGALREGELDYLGRDDTAEPAAHKLRFVQQSDTPEVHQDINLWVETQHCVPMRVESRDAEQQLIKRLWAEPGSIQAVGDKWVATQWTVENKTVALTTTAKIESLQYDDAVPPRAFQSTTYYEVP